MLVAIERGTLALDDFVADVDDVAIAAVTAAEMLVGVVLAATSAHRHARSESVEALLASIPVEDYDIDVARSHAELLASVRSSGRARGAHDLLIAATGVARRRTVVTADAAGFADLPGVDVRYAS